MGSNPIDGTDFQRLEKKFQKNIEKTWLFQTNYLSLYHIYNKIVELTKI